MILFDGIQGCFLQPPVAFNGDGKMACMYVFSLIPKNFSHQMHYFPACATVFVSNRFPNQWDPYSAPFSGTLSS